MQAMPTLDWIGKNAVREHHRTVPYHLLKCDRDLSVGDPDGGNLKTLPVADASGSLSRVVYGEACRLSAATLNRYGITFKRSSMFPLISRWFRMDEVEFEWDAQKELENVLKHGVNFAAAQRAFADPHRVYAEDLAHSGQEKRYYCLGLVDGDVLTVRFTVRGEKVRIIGAGFWRKGRRIYEKENQVHE
jgi:uncharacterized DUF497 family protein